MKRLLQALECLCLILLCILCHPLSVSAKELTPQTSGKGNSITVTAKDGSPIGAVYVKWNKAVTPYTLITDSEELPCGENGFLHEFIALDNPSNSLTFQIPGEKPMGIYEIRIFTDNDVPADVQIWEPVCERPDILLISAHADDEILFMGGIIPTYVPQGARVQVAYVTEFWSTTPVREHEKLDGLWVDGLHTYPVCGNFKDIYCETLADAEKKYDVNEIASFVQECLERFEPQVVVTHDFNGEYGHGFHQITARAVAQALEQSSYDVPKAYFHLYSENKIRMDLNQPIEAMGGKTALNIAKDAYLQHKSQQWCWFYVSDTYKYSCADFGLYKTTVGVDETNSMLDHLELRADQERRAEEERLERERLEKERLEKEQAEAAEKEKLAKIDEQLAQFQEEAEANAQKAAQELAALDQELKATRLRSTILIIGGVFALFFCAGFLIFQLRRERSDDPD